MVMDGLEGKSGGIERDLEIVRNVKDLRKATNWWSVDSYRKAEDQLLTFRDPDVYRLCDRHVHQRF